MDKDKKESSVLPSLGSKGVQANRRPIGQVPSAPPSRSIQINSNVIGAIGPSAKSTLKSTPPTWFKDKKPAANPNPKPSLPTTPAPAFSIVPPDSLEEDKASIPERPNRPILEKPSRPARGDAKSVKDTTPAHTLRAAAGDAWQDPTLADWDPNDFRIFVGDLGPEVNDTMLHQAFAPYGSITKCRVVRDRKSQKSKGYGFVGFREPQDFLKGIREMNGKYIGSRPVKLKKSTWTDRCADATPAKRSKNHK